MAYISSFAYCDSVRVENTPQGINQQIINPLPVIKPFSLPGNYSFTIVCCIGGLNQDQENEIRVCFVSPSGANLVDTGNCKINVPVNQLNVQRDVAQITLDIRNIVIQEAGEYVTKILVNDDFLNEFKISVRKGE